MAVLPAGVDKIAEVPPQIVEVVPGPPGTSIDLRCVSCRKLHLRWKVEDLAETGAVALEIRCVRCRVTTVFRLPFREAP